MTMSAGRSEEEQQSVRPAVLVALVSVSALLLGVWLALDWCVAPDDSRWQNLGRVVGVAGVLGALAGAWLLYRHGLRVGARLDEALRSCADRSERLRAVLDTTADGVLGVDEAGRITSCNQAGAILFGYRAAELVGQPLSFVLPGALGSLSEEVGTNEKRVLGNARTIEARRGDGSCFPVSLGISKVRLAGRPLYTVVVHDRSEVHQARCAALAATRDRSNFLVRMSHEVRTPLGGILGMAELLADTPLDDEQRCRLDTIHQSAEAVLAVFAQVIDFSQVEAGEMVLGQRGFSLRELLRQAVTPLIPQARSKGLRLEVDVAEDLPDRMRGDPLRLGQVLASLAGNAVKFTSRGEVVVSVERDPGATLDFPSWALRFEVRDTGPGIARDKLDVIFEPFEQADTSSTRKHGGVGLGLSLADRLARLMDGRIDVDSRPGWGSTFRFHVVLDEDSETVPAGPGAVLVVVGSDEERHTLEEHLTAWGVRVVGASTGRAALAELLRAGVEGNPFALVLIAEHLPDLSAREVLRRLRGPLDTPPPAILLGHSEKDLPAPAGFTAVLSRPVVPAELRHAVGEIVGRCASRVSEPA
jgi:two-component system sensor histidine kinase/response regulator